MSVRSGGNLYFGCCESLRTDDEGGHDVDDIEMGVLRSDERARGAVAEFLGGEVGDDGVGVGALGVWLEGVRGEDCGAGCVWHDCSSGGGDDYLFD